ncbi:hypothetical protein A7P54_03695 [Acinetobacter sp. Ac_3412]|uniref:hypothetical protein n=1 Tax=Acinetobacter sp. Ac_3412 TaxID=1848935 RepID=UPI00148FD937|nr:hypothetical protein [Acinetobacter sp. Ac_3412]NNP75522.1 hypothetical protein [Acinetobacter sp. Ac_3412]
MKFKEVFLAFGISFFLGYLYIAGRLVVEGYTYETGYDYLDLNFDFGDYSHIGFFSNLYIFLSNFPQIILLIFTIFIVYLLIFKYKSGKLEIKISYFLSYAWKRIIKKEKNIKPIVLYFNSARNILQKNLRVKENIISSYLLNSYFVFIFSTLIFYTALLFILKFYDHGKQYSKAEVLKQSHYINYDNRRIFKVICGKYQCIYATKSFDFFKKIKEENFDIETLKKINNYKTDESDFSFYHLSTESINHHENIIYVQVYLDEKYKDIMKKHPFEFRLYTTQSLPYKKNLAIEKTCYKNIKNEFTRKINNIEINIDENLPYFLAFKVPKNKSIQFIEKFDPAKNILRFNQCV